MGFLDKAKKFLGGKGTADVTITVIERQPAEHATFPVTDSVLKGTMVIDVKQDCTLLATKYQIWLEVEDGESTRRDLVAEGKDPDPNVSYSNSSLKMPCSIEAGQQIKKPWMVMDVDLAGYLSKAGISSPNAAVGNDKVTLKVKCIADVEGSPFDPCAEVTVGLTAT